jgi:hypothetical protein
MKGRPHNSKMEIAKNKRIEGCNKAEIERVKCTDENNKYLDEYLKTSYK